MNRRQQAQAFLIWWTQNYLTYNHGAQTSETIKSAGASVTKLLTQPARSLEPLQAMAVAMWTVRPDEDQWLSKSNDRGLKLLAHAADRLDQIASRRGQKAERSESWICPHIEPCTNAQMCRDATFLNRPVKQATG